MWSEPQKGRKREKGETDFLHFLHNFLSISSPKTLVCRMCRVCFPWTGGYGTCQNKKKYSKRESETLLLPSALQYRKMELLPRKPHHLVFFTFYPRVPGTLRYYYDQNTWTAHRLPALTLRREEKTNDPHGKVHRPLFLSYITPNWCSCETANGRLGLRLYCG